MTGISLWVLILESFIRLCLLYNLINQYLVRSVACGGLSIWGSYGILGGMEYLPGMGGGWEGGPLPKNFV